IQPSGALAAWQAQAAGRRVVMAAGADAHARLALAGEPQGGRLALPVPSYESSFRVASVHVRLDAPLTGRAAADGATLMPASRDGHRYTVGAGIAAPPASQFTATNSHGTVHEGDELGAGGGVLLRVQSNAPPAFTTVVYQDDRVIATARDTQD